VRHVFLTLYQDTLGRTDGLQAVPRPKRERRLPVVLSREEVQRLFAVVGNIKHKALFVVAYDAGFRLNPNGKSQFRTCFEIRFDRTERLVAMPANLVFKGFVKSFNHQISLVFAF
jgi:hypothetical protein